MKQPIKKKDFKKPSIASFKEKYGLAMKSNDDLIKSVARLIFVFSNCSWKINSGVIQI